MGQRGVKLFLEGQAPTKLKSGLGTIFSELIPGATPELNKRSHFNKTSHLKYLLPVSQSKLMEGGIPFHDECDQEVFLNPFSSEIKNKNMLVTGLSGSGKSVFVNKLVHKLIDKHPTVILDKGGSFKKLTDYHGGVVLSGGINPMQFKDPIFIREFILSVVDKNEFTKLCRGKLLFLIKEFLASSQEQSFKRLLKFLESEFAGISYYFEDIKDYISENNASEVPILYVDVESYPKNMIPPIIIFILGYFKNHKAKEKILVFDECWSFLADHSEYIDECFRTFRKSGAFPVAISQGIDDFKAINSSLSNSITNNSFFKIYFPQESRSEGDLTTFDRSRIKDLHFKKNVYSDCYLKSSDNKYRKIIRNYLTPLELELFHTEPGGDDHLNLFLENNKQYFKSTKDAIDAFVGLKYAQDTNSFNDANSHIWN
jgi:type IV secretory pathway VirB4 component